MVEIQSERRLQALVISLTGSLDALTADQAESFIMSQIDAGQEQIVLDLGQVDFMSSAGIRLVLQGLRRSRELGGDLRLASAQPGVERTLEISGLVRVLNLYPSVEEAVRSFAPEEP